MEADYVVIGGGSGGSALAYRLCEAGRKVIIVEFGGTDIGPFIQMPGALSYPMNMPRYDWGLMSEPEPGLGGRQKRDAARLTQLQRADRVLVHEGLFDRRRIGTVFGDDRAKPAIQRRQPRPQIVAAGMDDAIRKMPQARPVHRDHPPAHIAQARVYADDLHACSLFWKGLARKANIA